MAKLPEIISCSYEKGYFELREPAQKTRGGKYEGISGDAIENKWWQNVRESLSHDVDEKNELKSVSRDVDENTSA